MNPLDYQHSWTPNSHRSSPSHLTIDMPPFSIATSTSDANWESSHLWWSMYNHRTRVLNRSKLKQTSCISALLAGFALVALVEMDLYPIVPSGILLFFAITSTLLVGVHMIALMISTCILPHLDSLIAVEERACTYAPASPSSGNRPAHLSPTEPYAFGSDTNLAKTGLVGFIDFAWSCSTMVGIFLFILELVAIVWVKFYDTRMIALTATVLLVPFLVGLSYFVFRFYRMLMGIRFESAHREIDYLHRLRVVELSPQRQ